MFIHLRRTQDALEIVKQKRFVHNTATELNKHRQITGTSARLTRRQRETMDMDR